MLKPIVTDRVLFIMPLDRELQFPAMAVLQAYVLGFDNKMLQNDVSQGKVTWKLEYATQGFSLDDRNFWHKAGVVLPDETPLYMFDCVIDMSDARIKMYEGKHVAQACGIMGGVGVPPLPKLKKVQPKIDSFHWVAPDGQEGLGIVSDTITLDELLNVKDNEVTGIIGYASVETYLAVAKGLACVEILPPGRQRTWMSKWASSGYRMVEVSDKLVNHIQRAVVSIEKEIQDHVRRQLTITAGKQS